ncbi:hypothetical protein EV645_0005 [Kribbella rubisoli]|uniref:Uncharacterized protein n=1 Tax=Kribbella rubisoli TaxID=3075929 RepID=A0A4Q7XMI7_9ACTN|nr:hypothetical protein EV645_0005 [Kribbella rubisoli]
MGLTRAAPVSDAGTVTPRRGLPGLFKLLVEPVSTLRSAIRCWRASSDCSAWLRERPINLGRRRLGEREVEEADVNGDPPVSDVRSFCL